MDKLEPPNATAILTDKYITTPQLITNLDELYQYVHKYKIDEYYIHIARHYISNLFMSAIIAYKGDRNKIDIPYSILIQSIYSKKEMKETIDFCSINYCYLHI